MYMKTYYKLHIEQSSICADHCIDWSVSDPKDDKLRNTCQHVHTLKCDRCEIIKDIEFQLSTLVDALPVNQGCKDEYSKILSDALQKIFSWKSHILRTVNQDQFRLDALENISKDQALLVMDWAMKFLPIYHREKQSDWFGQRGKNWHVVVCVYKDADDALCHRTYCHVLVSAKHDWFSVASLLENVLQTVKQQLPNIKKVFLRSDNAGCYHCGQLWFTLLKIGQPTGIKIKQYCYSEPQAGKSYCDSKIAHMRTKMKWFAASGHDILTASDMKHALDSGAGVKGCQIANVAIDTTEQLFTTHKMKGINDYNDIDIEDDKLVLMKAYKIGTGHIVNNADINKFTNTKHNDHQSGCRILEDFVLPKMCTGGIKTNMRAEPDVTQPVDSSNEDQNTQTENMRNSLFYCPEVGCIKIFATYTGLENHLLCGKHHFKLKKQSTYDQIKLQWAQLCSEVVITCKNVKSATGNSIENESLHEPMGWALRKARKVVRFSVKVKNFLTQKFQQGEVSGKKTNPTDVAEEMKTFVGADGQKFVKAQEWLSTAQITFFFLKTG